VSQADDDSWLRRDLVPGPLIMLDHLPEQSLGVIILRPTGVHYSNQAGGTCCLHPTAEGAYFPISAPEVEKQIVGYVLGKYGSGGAMRLEESDIAPLNRALTVHLDTKHFVVDPAKIKVSCEAWVYVDVLEHPGRYK